MSSVDPDQVTMFLGKIEAGDEGALKELLPLVYQDLRSLAGKIFSSQKAAHTLQPTVLVHEAYMRLVRSDDRGFTNRKHFYRVAALAMRQLLTDYARSAGRQKRGDSARRVDLSDDLEASSSGEFEALALSEALSDLRELDPRQADVVELRFLVGLTGKEVAEALDVSERTVGLDWAMARSWLSRRMA